MSDLFNNILIGILQAVNIEKGYIPVEKISNLPAETYRATSIPQKEQVETTLD